MKKANDVLWSHSVTEYALLLQSGGKMRKHWTNARLKSPGQTPNSTTLCLMSEGLDGSALPAVVPTAYAFSLGCSYSFSAALAGRCFMILASPTSWDLQCNPGFTFTMYAIVSQDFHSCVLHDSEARTAGMMLPSLTTAYLGCSQKLQFVVAF